LRLVFFFTLPPPNFPSLIHNWEVWPKWVRPCWVLPFPFLHRESRSIYWTSIGRGLSLALFPPYVNHCTPFHLFFPVVFPPILMFSETDFSPPVAYRKRLTAHDCLLYGHAGAPKPVVEEPLVSYLENFSLRFPRMPFPVVKFCPFAPRSATFPFLFPERISGWRWFCCLRELYLDFGISVCASSA